MSFVSASQNETQMIGDKEILTVSEDNLQTEQTDEIISKNNDNDNLTTDVGTYTELENAFQVNEKFTFEKDYAAHEGDGIINIKKSIEIDGKGHTIDAGGHTGIFQSDSTESNNIEVTIKNLIFKNGKLDEGGAILVKKAEHITYNIINCTFISNQGKYGGAAIYFDSVTGHLGISDSKFIKNIIYNEKEKVYGGAAIYLNGETTGIRNTLFENNTGRAADGGAIYINDGNERGVLIKDCVFNNNKILRDDYSHGRYGGAIYNEGKSTLNVVNSNFTSNCVNTIDGNNDRSYFYDLQGGAIYSENILEIDGCVFEKNTAFDKGGAICANVLKWGQNPSTFIKNYVNTWNIVSANKGGAIYASTFANTAFGHRFINNSGYYGGAIYINNKNDVIFQSCYFEGNVAMTESKTHGSGAAIYIDSSSSTVTMMDNIFINNKATSDSAIFNCGKYGTIANNWWGTNNPNFNDAKYIVEWHRVGSNTIVSDEKYLRAYINGTASQASGSKLTIYFINNKGEAFTGKLTDWNVEFSSDKEGVFTDKQLGDNKATVSFTTNALQETVTAKINNQILTLNVTQTEGDFAWLQKQINAANGTLDLTHDIIYTIGLDTITEGIKIEKSIIIKGNGHKINALGKSRIFDIIGTENVILDNITFMNGFTDTYAGAIKMDRVNNVKILNSNFINNTAAESCGAVLYENGIGLNISNCNFTNNKNDKYFGGAIHIIHCENVIVEKSKFTNNTASDGGAIAISGDKNITIDGCEFRLNTAFKADGGAIYNGAENVTIKNSIFLENKAKGKSIEYQINGTALTLALTGGANYINAIESEENITFSNVTYWNGKITTGSSPVRSSNERGINISLTVKDSQNRVIKNVTLTTNANGQAVFNFDSLVDGKYTFNATHFEDKYYTQVSEDDEFSVSKIHTYPSEVKINIENGTEFEYGKVKISFEVTNKTFVEVVITNSDFSQVLYDNETNLSYVIVDLPASNEYYNIIVFNHGNATYESTSAEKAFKILKTNSIVKINPIDDVKYSDTITVSFSGESSAYEVTVYDALNNTVFNQVTTKNSINIPGRFAVGTYNITVVNRGDENRTESRNSTKFNIIPKENTIVISADDAVYGNGVVVFITATAEGEYTAHINSTNVTIHVNNGYGSAALELAAGTYTTNVSFSNPNYINVIEAYNFTVTKAQSNVDIDVGNIIYGQNKTVAISDDFPTQYNVTLIDSGNNIILSEIINNTSFVLPALEVGIYNLTVTNLGNENITGSEKSKLIEVTADNYVSIMIEDTEYGKELVIMIFADVDGYYTVDINGTELTIEVKNGFGYNNDTILDAGQYYANVTFDHPDYNNIIENTTFTVYQAESNIHIIDIGNVTYGEEIIVKYYDNYDVIFEVVVFDENEEVVFEIKTNSLTVILHELAAGNYTVMVTTEDNKNIIGTSEFKSFTILKATPKIDVVYQNVTYPNDVIVAVISDVSGNYTVSFADKNQTIFIKAGNFTELVYSNLTPNKYLFNITYIGNENYTSVSKTVTISVTKNPTSLTVKGTTATYNVNKYLVITLKDSKGRPLANASVTVKLGTAKKYTTDKNGQVKVKISNLVPKTYTAKITFAGKDNYLGSHATAKVVVKKATPKLASSKKIYKTTTKTKMYTITLKDNKGKPIKNAKVTLKVNGKTYKAITNSKGKATFKITKLNEKGTFKATITYKGNKYYKKITQKVKIKVVSIWKTISKGSKEKFIVKEIQRALKNHGYYLTAYGHYLMVDGNYWVWTVKAVKQFQKVKGLKLTGKVDEKTAKKLKII